VVLSGRQHCLSEVFSIRKYETVQGKRIAIYE
jgi:hypothetical protein